MKGKFRNLLVGLCGALATLGLAVGVFTAMPTMQASAESSAPTVTMLAGASARKTPGEPGIKFTAKIDNYDKSYQYGMLILPEAAWHACGWDNDTDFFEYFEEERITKYANMICAPYTTDNGERQISFSLRNLYAENYSRGFFGVAYTLKDGVYNYADVDMVTNARSIAYVAQMALKYEDYLTQEQSSTLSSYANAGLIIEKDDYFSEGMMQNGGSTSAVESNYVARFDIDYIADGNSGETANSFVTKEAYAGGSTVSFKTYIPTDSVTGGWWSVCWTTNPSSVNIYAHAEGNGQALPLTKGAWQDVSFTLPAGGPYYIYFAGAKGEWGHYGDNGEGYVYIENFTVGSTTENFSANTSDWIFAVNTPKAVSAYEYQKASMNIGGAAKARSAKIFINKISSVADEPSFITAETYAGGTVTFDYYMSGNTLNKWWTLNWTNNNTVASIYAFVEEGNKANNYGVELPVEQDSWQTATVTIPDGNWYLYFAGSVGDWGDGYVLIDNFRIESADYTETFDFGLDDSIFAVNRESAIVEGEGYEENTEIEKLGDLAMKYIFNESGEVVSQVTKEAYAGGSAVSFKYYIPAGTPTSWWGLSWSTSNTGLDIYAAASSSTANTILGSKTATGEWVDVDFTLPAGGPYYLYFGSEISASNWKLNGENSYMLIDDFTVGDVTETFDFGLKNSIFKVLVESAVSTGDGYVPLSGAFGAKLTIDLLSSTKTTPSFITAEKYAGGIVTFDYYMTGNTKNKWWTLNWTTSNTAANIYAFVEPTETNDGVSLPVVQDSWQTATVEVPAGNWYFYFAGAVGEWSNGYVIIDNFYISGADYTETFNTGLGIFLDNRSSKPDAITLAEGKEEFVPGEYAMKYIFNASGEVVSQVTKQAYAGGSGFL